ncbi:MAG: LysM domain-containing protein [Lachnospiraceae bacterium]|nr:LysM domain-containing protein [Lachnospiraceae bacterium]
MIEIIYSDNKEEKTVGFPVKLPRNFRQIGSGEDYRKVYIEDYVMTYIRKLWEKSGQEYQTGVLMGSCKKYGGETYLFISGAVRAEEIEQEGSTLKFTDKVWTDLYEKIKQYFNDLEIVGWFYARNDSVREVDAGLFKTHVDNFGGVDKVLFLIDKKEKEEEFYAYENGQLARLSGYYVYYEKNEQMQEYMVEQAPGESVDEQNEDRVTSNYRMLVQEKQDTHTKKKWSSTLYTACTCLVIAILAAGTVFVRDYDKMQQLESQVHQLAVSVLRQDTETIAVEQVKGDVYPTETESGTIQNFPMQSTETSEETILNTEESAIIETTSVQETTTEKETETEEETTIETTTAETSGIQSISGQAGYYYTVKKGETLTSICIAVYQSDHMVSAIKEANGIEDGDKIYPGQEIYLP